MKTGIFSLQFYFHPLRRLCQRANLRQGKRFGFSLVNTKATRNKNNHIHADRGVLDDSIKPYKTKTGGWISLEVINDFLYNFLLSFHSIFIFIYSFTKFFCKLQ